MALAGRADDKKRYHALLLFNTMSQKKERLVSQGGAVQMFVCGPTVQSYIHMGHARTYVFYDVLARYLTHLGLRVNFLMNITDIDDRITEAAKREGVKPGDVVEKYTASFLEDLRGLKVNSVTRFERVSNYVTVMIDQVSTLVKDGFAYVADDVVYFDISKYRDYGKLSHQSKSDLSLRPLELSPNKKNLLDFGLWRPVVLEEGKWDSPWGRGSPGWHIQDTAVTLTNFGSQYDIHGGAYELVYPHHEAELAQGESLTGVKPLVKHWVHTGLVNLSGRKMSKSAGNTQLVKEVLQDNSADQLRHYLLSWHYRDDVEFSLNRLEKASKSYSNNTTSKARERLATRRSQRSAKSTDVHDMLSPFYSAMNDDLDTPKAMKWVETELVGRDPSDGVSNSALRIVSDILGVNYLAKS